MVEGGSGGLAREGEASTPSVSLNVPLTSKTPSSNIKHLPGRESGTEEERDGGREEERDGGRESKSET